MTESLERTTRRALVATLFALSGLAWLLTVRNARSMADMAMGLGQVGRGCSPPLPRLSSPTEW